LDFYFKFLMGTLFICSNDVMQSYKYMYKFKLVVGLQLVDVGQVEVGQVEVGQVEVGQVEQLEEVVEQDAVGVAEVVVVWDASSSHPSF
jgi:NADH/NAD ratio-sensing transcriptional regulator Rex